MASIPLIRVNPRARAQRERISENEFCTVVDDFLVDPEGLVEAAAQHRGEFSKPNIGYPGVQLRVDDNSMADIYRFVRSSMSKAHGFMRGRIGVRSLLSILTVPPEELSFMQRICHIDPNPSSGRAKFAALVYLFSDECLGGTSFYRFRDEELVWEGVAMLRESASKGEEFLKAHFETFRGPPRYMSDSNEIAERLCTVPARFNRFVFYSGDVPHSAAITNPELLIDDCRKGRLTLNLFFSVLPQGDVPRAA